MREPTDQLYIRSRLSRLDRDIRATYRFLESKDRHLRISQELINVFNRIHLGGNCGENKTGISKVSPRRVISKKYLLNFYSLSGLIVKETGRPSGQLNTRWIRPQVLCYQLYDGSGKPKKVEWLREEEQSHPQMVPGHVGLDGNQKVDELAKKKEPLHLSCLNL